MDKSKNQGISLAPIDRRLDIQGRGITASGNKVNKIKN
jgi:hypothetical protein